MSSLTVIIPAYNEARTIVPVIRQAVATGLVAEVIVVDDGSTDGTAGVVFAMPGSVTTAVKLLRHEANRGKGAAIRTGLAAARGDLVLIQDADLEYSPSDYARLLAPFESDQLVGRPRPTSEPRVDAVYGSRNLHRNRRSSQLFYWGGRGLSLLANLLYGSRLTDVTTGYKLVRTDLLRKLALRADGFEFCAELTARLLRAGARIIEVPIAYRPRTRAEGKKIRIRDGVHSAWTLLVLRAASARHGQ